MVDDPRARLHALIRTHALKVSDGEPFRLASGRTSSFLFDVKPVSLHPEGAAITADLLLDRLSELPDVTAVAGVELGAVPLVSAMVARSGLRNRPVPGLVVRKQVKDRGTMNRIEGDAKPPGRVVLLEDVTTTGGSVLTAVEVLREAGWTVDTVFTVVDREEGATENLKEEGLELHALFRKRDFGVEA